MRNKLILLYWVISSLSLSAQPICLHPANPHYFLFRGKTTVIVSSAEHYGAVINPAFNYTQYLSTLKADGMNYTRIFTGVYFENAQSFGIEKNTLAPDPGMALTPWRRSNIPGAVYGGNKFDLDQWNDDYFQRLRDFVRKADEQDIIVEITLFSSIYGYWNIQAFNFRNNVNVKEDISKNDVQTLNNRNLMYYQERMVRKIVKELNEFDNVFYEIQNEPWADHPVEVRQISDYLTKDNLKSVGLNWRNNIHLADSSSLDWQEMISSIIIDEERSLTKKHLIAQNYCNFFYPLNGINPDISILNFHYALPEVVFYNYNYNRVIGFDETGFSGNADSTYKKQAWKFILSGGALFNNLDYSFFVGREDGTGINKAPGGGSQRLRKQLKVLSNFINSFHLEKMKPDYETVILAPGTFTYTLSEPGKQYALYLENRRNSNLEIFLPEGNFKIEWINTLNGNIEKVEVLNHKGGTIVLASPEYSDDIALRILNY